MQPSLFPRRSRSVARLASAAVAALLLTAAPAHAQGMLGRIKSKAVDAASAAAKKAGEAKPAPAATPNATPPASNATASAPNATAATASSAPAMSTLPPVPATPASPPPLHGVVIRMTAPVVDRLMSALAADARVHAYGATMLARPAPDGKARGACIARLVKDPNFQALQTRQAAQPWEISGHELKDSVVNEQCGIDYPSHYRSYVYGHGQSIALGVSGLSQDQYRILLERVVPFCDAYASGGKKALRIAYTGNGGGGRNAYYVYTAEEADALAPHCADVLREVPTIEAGT